jgi:NTP pyrophosphatase (non-canonical NTP hydrolase)
MNGSKDLYDFLLHKWGTDAQVMMLLEEQSELTKELLKLRRRNGYHGLDEEQQSSLADEIADNFIMLEQMMHIFNVEEEVEKTINYKLNRIAERSGYFQRLKDILPNDAVIEGDEE